MYVLLAIFGIFIYAFDGHNIVKEVIVTRYRRFRELNKFVQTRYKTIGAILWVSCCLIAKMYWMNFLQWANNTVEHIDHKTTIISYTLNGKIYRTVVQVKRGPISILLITDNENNDISDQVLPFFGPGQDWHGKEFSPSFWKKKSLTFELSNGENIFFSENEPILVPN